LLFLYVAAETDWGLKPLWWIDRLVRVLEWRRFPQEDGSQAKMRSFEESIFGKLREIQVDRPDYLISLGLDVTEEFGLAQSFWRGAVTTVQNAGVWNIAVLSRMYAHSFSDMRQMTRTLL